MQESTRVELFDSHAHLNDEKFNIDREKVIPEIYNSGITKFVNCGYSMQSSIEAIELAKKYDFIYATVGISPNDLSTNWREDVDNIDKILQNELNNNTQNLDDNKQNQPSKIVAIGEISQ